MSEIAGSEKKMICYWDETEGKARRGHVVTTCGNGVRRVIFDPGFPKTGRRNYIIATSLVVVGDRIQYIWDP